MAPVVRNTTMAVTTFRYSDNKLVQYTQRDQPRICAGESVLSLHGRGHHQHHPPASRAEKGRRGHQYPAGRASAEGRRIASAYGSIPHGNEEAIDNYGMRVWVDWNRNAVATNEAEGQKDSADIFGEAKPLSERLGQGRAARRNHRSDDGAADRELIRPISALRPASASMASSMRRPRARSVLPGTPRTTTGWSTAICSATM